jgi:arginyl-tRNA synthetase
MTIEGNLATVVKQALKQAFPEAEQEKVQITAATNKRFGDFQTNIAMQLTKELKQNPLHIAESIANEMEQPSWTEKVEVVKPGFINFFLTDEFILEQFQHTIQDSRYRVPQVETERKTVVIDYSSPNVAKPLHIGHIRSTIIGNALDRIYRFIGYDVVADNHLGDWGTQFGMMIYGYKHFLDKQAFEEDPIKELERIYVKTNQLSEVDERVRQDVRDELVKLQQGESENYAIWERIIEKGMESVKILYDRLDIHFDTTKGESFYRDRLNGVVDTLRERGIAQPSEGAWVIFYEDEKLPPAIVKKKDGGFNYLTTDIATILHRVQEYPNVDRILYVTDERQQLHFKQLFHAVKRLNLPELNAIQLEHLWFGLMRLPQGTFSTREGNVIKLEALLDEAERRALQVVNEASPQLDQQEREHIAKVVGIAAVKYADLSQNRQSTVTFDWDKMLSLDGNTAPYLLYAYARIQSIFRKYQTLDDTGEYANQPILIQAEVERDLIMTVLRYSEAVYKAAELYKPNMLCDYLFGLTTQYNHFYQNHSVLKAETKAIRNSRLQLCEAVAGILKSGLSLLGIQVLERM